MKLTFIEPRWDNLLHITNNCDSWSFNLGQSDTKVHTFSTSSLCLSSAQSPLNLFWNGSCWIFTQFSFLVGSFTSFTIPLPPKMIAIFWKPQLCGFQIHDCIIQKYLSPLPLKTHQKSRSWNRNANPSLKKIIDGICDPKSQSMKMEKDMGKSNDLA